MLIHGVYVHLPFGVNSPGCSLACSACISSFSFNCWAVEQETRVVLQAKVSKETLNECLTELAGVIVTLASRLHDLFLVIMFATAIVISVFRGLVSRDDVFSTET